MAYAWIDHTAELELAIDAPTEDSAFGDAVAAVRELIGRRPVGEPQERSLSLEAADEPSLFAAFVDELVFLAETEAFLAEHLVAFRRDGARLEARVSGRRGRPAHLIKAATLSNLSFTHDTDGWHARVVLDV